MDRAALIAQYNGKIARSILEQYGDYEKYIIVNDDDIDLYPIRIDLPEPPEYHLIDGWKLPAKEQYFRRPIIPERLQKLIKTCKSIDKIYLALNNDKKTYHDEIVWIYTQWHYRLNGYWFFNNGIPTYIDGWHWFYLSWWKLDSGYPEYRYRDRIFFLFARYAYTTTTATFFYKILDAENNEMLFSKEAEAYKYCTTNNILRTPENGIFVKDYGIRTCMGFNYPKHRREGATYKASCIHYELISRTEEARGAIQSMDESSAYEKVYKEKIIYPFRRLPFFFVPYFTGSTSPKDGLNFDIPAKKMGSSGSMTVSETGLLSQIGYYTSADRACDGTKFLVHHGDEVGKVNNNAPYNAVLRHNVIYKCVSEGSEIRGFVMNTSTVDDTKGDGGRNFMHLCMMSKWDERSFTTGLTQSGLINLYIPAYVNLGGFSDRYGNPIIDTPTEEQRKYIKKEYGAKKFLEDKLNQVRDNPISYYETLREFPTKFRHCFMTSSGDSGFNLKILSERLSQINMGWVNKPRIGNFFEINDTIEFVDNPDGKFKINYIPERTNAFIVKDGKRYPTNYNTLYASADPFKVEKTKDGQRSNSACAVFLKRNTLIDGDGKDVRDWSTHRFVCIYDNRVATKEEFARDVLMMCRFYGCTLFPENNIDDVEIHFKKMGYSGYLKYIISGGKKAPRAGFTTTQEVKQDLFQEFIQYIENHGMNEQFAEVLEQCRDITGVNDMTNYDLFTACGGCLLSVANDNSRYIKHVTDSNSADELTSGLLRMAKKV